MPTQEQLKRALMNLANCLFYIPAVSTLALRLARLVAPKGQTRGGEVRRSVDADLLSPRNGFVTLVKRQPHFPTGW